MKRKPTKTRELTPMEKIQELQEKIDDMKNELSRQISTALCEFTEESGAWVEEIKIDYDINDVDFDDKDELIAGDFSVTIILQEDNG